MSGDLEKLEAAGTAAEAQANSPVGGVEECPANSDWIEVVLVGEDERGIADEPYVLQLADGSAREGKTDAEGRVRVDGIPAGDCSFSFPELDTEAWAPD